MKKFIITLFICALEFTPTWAQAITTYYISDCQTGADANCVAGSNGNNGISPSTPFLNLSGLPSGISGLAAGDQVLWAKGSSQNFSASVTVNNSNATAANPIIFGAYVPSWGPGTAKPRMTLTASIPDCLNPTQLFNLTGTGQNGFTFDGLDFRASGLNATCSFGAVYLAGTVNYVKFINNTCDGIGSCITTAAHVPHSSNLTITGNNFYRSTSMAVLTTVDNLLIENNYFLDNAQSGDVRDHEIYIASATSSVGSPGAKNNTIRRNILERTSSAPCSAVMIVQHNEFWGLRVEENILKQSSGTAAGTCYGIQLAQGNFDSDIEGCHACVVSGNTISNVGYVSIDVSQCDSCVIENNVVVPQSGGSAVGIRFGGIAPSANDIAMSKNTVRSNSCYMANPQADNYCIEFGPNDSGTGHSVTGNLMYLTNNANIAYCTFVDTIGTSAFTAWNRNLCYVAGGSARWGRISGTAYTTLSAWNSATGFDANSLNTDPVLVATPSSANGFSMKVNTSTSPAKNACTTALCSRLAIHGIKRDTTPYIGAFDANN